MPGGQEGPQPDSVCTTCGLPGHPSKLSTYCAQHVPNRVAGRERVNEQGAFWYRDYAWKCSWTRFCKDADVGRTVDAAVGLMSRVRFEATRFLQLFLSLVDIGPTAPPLAIKDSSIDNLLKAFTRPATPGMAATLTYLAAFHPSAPAMFTQHYLPTRGTATWPGDFSAGVPSTMVLLSVESMRRQLGAAWKRHVVYNIGTWTVAWIKDRLIGELGQAMWEAMPSWQRGKMAWAIYSYISVGECDGTVFRKKIKRARNTAGEANVAAQDAEELLPFALPALRDRQWPGGALAACGVIITDLVARFGPVDHSKKDTGGIISGNPNVEHLWYVF
jgi:hypothetical protein